MTIFLPTKTGGWVNAANVVTIVGDCAYVAHPGAGCDTALAEGWQDINNQLVLGDGALREIEANLAGINSVLNEIYLVAVNK